MMSGVAQVLEALVDAGPTPCSGEELSARLGVSRAQIWKHVGTLRKRGYEIEGAPGGGYRLLERPDRLYPEEVHRGLETTWLGRPLHHFESTDSTNRIATELARDGAPHGTAVVAEGQTAGRGRLGRSFYSPASSNLYTSIVLRPDLEIVHSPTLLLAAGVAVAETVARILGPDHALEIKWPNDVLIDGRKTSGILMELGAEEARVSYAILGIGVNLNVDPESFPDEFRARATSLRAQAGRRIDRVDFTRRLYSSLEDVLDVHARGGFEAVRPRFDSHFKMLGRSIEVSRIGDDPLAGVATGVAENGALEVETPDGSTIRVLAGDVTLSGRTREPQENPSP
jgi:BirA family biotin operon repressor/biotin-[acetyl-CoA-carboxylase] ligase